MILAFFLVLSPSTSNEEDLLPAQSFHPLHPATRSIKRVMKQCMKRPGVRSGGPCACAIR